MAVAEHVGSEITIDRDNAPTKDMVDKHTTWMKRTFFKETVQKELETILYESLAHKEFDVANYILDKGLDLNTLSYSPIKATLDFPKELSDDNKPLKFMERCFELGYKFKPDETPLTNLMQTDAIKVDRVFDKTFSLLLKNGANINAEGEGPFQAAQDYLFTHGDDHRAVSFIQSKPETSLVNISNDRMEAYLANPYVTEFATTEYLKLKDDKELYLDIFQKCIHYHNDDLMVNILDLTEIDNNTLSRTLFEFDTCSDKFALKALSKGADINYVDPDTKMSTLENHLARRNYDCRDNTDLFIKNGVKLDENNDRSLVFAAGSGNLHAFKMLVEFGANIHQADDQALILASQYSSDDIEKYSGSSFSVHPMSYELAKGQKAIFNYLVHDLDITISDSTRDKIKMHAKPEPLKIVEAKPLADALQKNLATKEEPAQTKQKRFKL